MQMVSNTGLSKKKQFSHDIQQIRISSPKNPSQDSLFPEVIPVLRDLENNMSLLELKVIHSEDEEPETTDKFDFESE